MTFRLRSLVFALLVFALPALVSAHPGHDGHDLTWDFTGGVLHPLFGLDHVIVMVGVGLWAALLGGSARWVLPVAFLVTVGTTSASSAGASAPVWLEQVLASSVLLLGCCIAGVRRSRLLVGVALSAAFAVFHGWAHGAEIPAGTHAAAYSAGLVVATALLLAVGAGVGRGLQAVAPRWQTIAGVGVAATGLAIIAV